MRGRRFPVILGNVRAESHKAFGGAARGIALMTLPVLLLCSQGCATLDAVTGKQVINFYTLEEDVQLGRQVLLNNIEQMRKAGVAINQDPVRLSQLSNIVQRIAAVSHLPDLPYTVTLFHTGIVNAAAAPGGAIMVFEGLFDPQKGLVRDEDELAAVLAHEIAHVNCRHTTERLSALALAGLATELVASWTEDEDPETARALRTVFNIGALLVIPSYSRQDEYEADRVGLFYMARAGYDPRAAVRIWKRAAEKDPGGWGPLSILATHPGAAERARALEKLLPEAMQVYAKACSPAAAH